MLNALGAGPKVEAHLFRRQLDVPVTFLGASRNAHALPATAGRVWQDFFVNAQHVSICS